MQGWQVALAIVMGLGVAVILLGAFVDRERRLQQDRERTLPPDRPIPGLPANATPPRYLDHDDAVRLPPDDGRGEASSAGSSPATRTRLKARMRTTTPVAVGCREPDLVTDTDAGWAVAQTPAVLVCNDPVESFRELLPVIHQTLSAAATPSNGQTTHPAALVIVAPALHRDVQRTLVANHRQHLLQVVTVIADRAQCAQVAELAGATPLDRADRQSGYLPAGALGTVTLWVSSAHQTWVLGSEDSAGDPLSAAG